MLTKDTPLFDNTSLSDIFKNIYATTRKKESQIDRLVAALQPHIKTVSDAAVVVPLIKEFLEVGVKNNEHMVKLAGVAQRLLQSSVRLNTSSSDHPFLTEEEKRALLLDLEESMDPEERKGADMVKEELRKLEQDSSDELEF